MCLLSETLILEWVFLRSGCEVVNSQARSLHQPKAKSISLWYSFNVFKRSGPFDVYFPSNEIEFHGAAHLRMREMQYPLLPAPSNVINTQTACISYVCMLLMEARTTMWNIFIIMHIKCMQFLCSPRNTISFFINSPDPVDSRWWFNLTLV